MAEDFTQGSIARKLAIFALPIMLTNLLQVSMQLINSLWVGNLLGSAAFGAVTVGTTVMMLILAFVIGINNATLTIFGQLKGAGNQENIKAYLSTFIVLLGGLAAAIGLFGFVFTENILAWLRTPPTIVEEAATYLRINFVGIFFLVGYNFVGTVLRAFGDSKTPLHFVLLATVLTAVLGPLFIVGFSLDVAGAAWAIVMAQSGAFLYSVVYLWKRYPHHGFRLRPPKFEEVKTILELGVPSGVQMIVIHAGMTILLSLVNTLGADAVAGYGVAQRLDSIILLPALALGTAVNAMAAQNIGAQLWDRVSRIARVGIAYNAGVMVSIASVLFIWARPLVEMFIQEPASVAFGTTYLKTIALFYPFIGINFILNGIVRGSGAMFQVLVLNIISLWVLRLPLAYVATGICGGQGIALGIGLSFFMSSLFSIAYYCWGGWRKKVLFAPA